MSYLVTNIKRVNDLLKTIYHLTSQQMIQGTNYITYSIKGNSHKILITNKYIELILLIDLNYYTLNVSIYF